ncbi:MAG: hypothetical protein KA715_05120 [Xanthomonadaceae bacterium]|nr:hypothetical protein [Xanthomonadaceae bacterium]
MSRPLPELLPNHWSNLSQVVYYRTYARQDNGRIEHWPDTVERVIRGNVKDHKVTEAEIARLRHFMMNRKALPAGRGLWFSGTDAHSKMGGAALNNCWFLKGDDWQNLVLAQDLLMLGGGVGFSIQKKFVTALPEIKKGVAIREESSSSYVVDDSREGWCELVRRTLESYFFTGKSFDYSLKNIRPKGEAIKGFGGRTAGPDPLRLAIKKISARIGEKWSSGGKVSPLGMMDLLCIIGEMVVSGNVRRSAILILGDATDSEFLHSKRWDLGTLPSYRAMANLSVGIKNISELSPEFWETFEHGEPFGIVHLDNIQTYGRMGEKKHDDAIGVNPCAETTLTNGEPCNLQDIFLPRLDNEEEFIEAARLMHRYGKRITCEKFHHSVNATAVAKYRRVGTGITGCLQSTLFNKKTLDRVYAEIQKENVNYSRELGIPESIRTTVIKPSGTLSLLGDCLPGIHPAYSKYYLRRVRFDKNDPLIPILKSAGHPLEPMATLDGGIDPNTLVVSFPCETLEGDPTADSGFDTFKQLDTLLFAQKHWADQSVSVTIYYKREELSKIKNWVSKHLSEIKTVSFLAHSEHGFKQAPYESLNQKNFEILRSNIKPADFSGLSKVFEGDLADCEGTACPAK